MSLQRAMVHNYSATMRPDFNAKLFHRTDEELINALRDVIYSCERDASFKIKVTNFTVIDDYDDVNHILWEYEEAILNKGKKVESKKPSKDNPYNYINLKDSDLKIIKVDYHIGITEKKNGYVEDDVTAYIAVPRIIDGFYFRLNGNLYSAMYQIVDASTYNNSAAKNAKKHSVTMRTAFTPLRIYRYSSTMTTVSGEAIPCTYFMVFAFKKYVYLIKYIIARMGYYEAIKFLHIMGVSITDNCSNFSAETNYIFPVKNGYIIADKNLYDSIQTIQSFVYTVYQTLMSDDNANVDSVLDNVFWIKRLGMDFTSKDLDTIYAKGLSILSSLDFSYDIDSKNDLHLSEEDRGDIYRVLRWLMYEFNALRQKDNLDITTKRIRWAEYCAAYYATKLANGIYRISDNGDKADLATIRKAIQIPPMYMINQFSSVSNGGGLVTYKDCVNDLDAITALKYTYKGISGIGDKSKAISKAYRSIHPSHLGRVDIDSSSNSDPGISGTICPLTQIYDNHFSQYSEPSTWQSDLAKAIENHSKMLGAVEICRIIADVSPTTKQAYKKQITDDCLAISRKLIDYALLASSTEEYINGYDVFGNDRLYVTYD